METELKQELKEIKKSVHKIDRDVLVIVTKFEEIEKKVDKINGFCKVAIENKRSITFLTRGFWTVAGAVFMGLTGMVFLVIRMVIK